ncbi:MAG: sigma 54-interacting transcriptional regulator [Pseudomonadota bacterium]
MSTSDTLDTRSIPSDLRARLVPETENDQLLATIVFHPELERIGEVSCLGALSSHHRLNLGRLEPHFAPSECVGTEWARPLAEDYVSREAVDLVLRGGDVSLLRKSGSSRAQVDGLELGEEAVLISAEQLRRGIALSLSHSVVLLLHTGRVPCQQSAPEDGLMLGRGQSMQALREQIQRVARAQVDVLIRGETGTGKELVARALHAASQRCAGPLIVVNMAAIPPGLAAAMLFGAARGAFTGAERSREGYFQAAHGGTLFLDEVGDTPAEVQPQLLRALQQREVQQVGGPVSRVDVRVVSATDADIDRPGGSFRAALLHRLGAAELSLPPLRERREDLATLLCHFLKRELDKLGRGGLFQSKSTSVATTALWAQLFHYFVRYDWPGNVRELENAATAVALASDEQPTLPPGLFQRIRQTPMSDVEDIAPVRPLTDYSDEEIKSALRQCEFEIAATSRQLGVTRSALYRRLEKTPGIRLPVEIPIEEIRETLARYDGDEQAAARQLCISCSGLRGRIGREVPGNGGLR